jgi:hypothetical protein
MLNVLGIKDAEKLVPLPDDQKPRDPVTENMNVLKGEPVKAFVHQDHESHIKVHTSAAQDPTIMQLIGQNPKAPQIQAAMAAHIAEHVGFAYRQKIEQQLGMALPPEDEKLPPQVEIALSQMMAQAAQQVLQQSQAKQAQQQAQQQAQDPMIQMQQQDLQLRQKELELKEKKMALDAAAQADKLDIERERMTGTLELNSMKVGAQIQESKAKSAAQQERDGVRMGIDIAKQKAQQDLQVKQASLKHIAAFKQNNKGQPPK